MEADALAREIVQRARHVAGIAAIVLGGSRARGTHWPGSDIDLCFYYEPDRPPDLAELGRLAAELDDAHRPDVLTEIGGWGPWINGGGWLTVRGQAVDFLYPDLGRVRAIIAACRAGQLEVVYQPGHPHAFVSSIYMAEAALCQLLWDPCGTLAGLKSAARPYPAALRQATIQRFGWEINFALQTGRKAIARGDVTYAAGSMFRSVACMLHCLFAVNEQYWLNEKGAVELAATFPRCPARLKARVESAFAHLDAGEASMARGLAELEGLSEEAAALLA